MILLEDGSHNVDYQGKQYCFLLAAVDNGRTNKGENMKPNRSETCGRTEHRMAKRPRPDTTTAERARQRQQDQNFIKAMNELTAKAGLLSDDPYFGGL
ncbi:TPA: hypothetical protein ACI4DF_001236 [Enterobacter hormaechei]